MQSYQNTQEIHSIRNDFMYDAKVEKEQTKVKKVDPKIISEYNLRRSLSSPRLVDVVASDSKGRMITVVESDMDFDKASAFVDALNSAIQNESLDA
jgi:hypothetical protein